MPQKIIIYFLLLNLLNTVFFVGERMDSNPYDAIEEITEEEYNSVVEFVMEGCMDVQDDTPEDEDDDVPDSLEIQKIVDFYFLTSFEFVPFEYTERVNNTFIRSSLVASRVLEKHSPPPRLV